LQNKSQIESILCWSIVPTRVFQQRKEWKHWVTAVTHFDKVEMKALEQIYSAKNRGLALFLLSRDRLV
jgi:hypothetical protein